MTSDSALLREFKGSDSCENDSVVMAETNIIRLRILVFILKTECLTLITKIDQKSYSISRNI